MRIMLEASHKYIKKKHLKTTGRSFSRLKRKTAQAGGRPIINYRSLNVTENEGGMVSCIQRKNNKNHELRKSNKPMGKKVQGRPFRSPKG